MALEQIFLAVVDLDTLQKIWGDRLEVFSDYGLGVSTRDDHLLEVFIENISNNLDKKVWLGVQKGWRRSLLDLLLNSIPMRLQSGNIQSELLFGCSLGCSANNYAGFFRNDVLQDLL